MREKSMDNGIKLIVKYLDNQNVDVDEVREILVIELNRQIKNGLYAKGSNNGAEKG